MFEQHSSICRCISTTKLRHENQPNLEELLWSDQAKRPRSHCIADEQDKFSKIAQQTKLLIGSFNNNNKKQKDSRCTLFPLGVYLSDAMRAG